MELENARILITGGARGLGRQFVLDLAERKARVGLCATSEEGLRSVREDFERRGLDVFTCRADVSDEEQVRELFARFVEHYGGLDAVVNNAGITRDALLVKKKDGNVQVMPREYWQSVIDVNLTGVFLCGREAARILVDQGTGGVIVSISSVNRHGSLGQTNYSAAKAGVVAMTVTWAKELARHGIRVAALAPGYIETEMTGMIREDVRKKIESAIPLGRFGTVQEVSHALRFILENDYVSGRTIDVDGGMRV
ncbi:MAG: SDR family oxidoreductase [Deferrisomatales bacterium]